MFAEILLADTLTTVATISTVAVGISTGMVAYFGSPYYWSAIEYFQRDFGDKLRRMHLPTHNLRRQIVAWSIAVAAGFLGFLLIGDSPIFGVLAAALMFCGPWLLIRRMADRYRLRLEEQLADAMVSLSAAIRAGLSLGQALEVLADQSPKPINAEFARIVGEYGMGKPLDRTLKEAKDRLRSENFALFAAALLASRESGGRLNETVERIAHSVRELQRLERKVISETAMARKSAVYMALAPFFILVMYYVADPVAVSQLFVTPPGQLILAAAIVLNLAAYLWARIILNPDI